MSIVPIARKGFSLIELMIVVAIACLIGGIVVIAMLVWGWSKASVDVVGANRAYGAVMHAHYVHAELIATYEDCAPYCHAADDAVGYGLLATPEDGDGRVSLTVCCPSTLSSRPCTVHPDGQ